MAKYIIDIPDEAIEFMGSCINVFVEPEFKIGDCKRYALRICKDDITPYTEPDLNPLVDEAVETIENEVWELANYMGRMSLTERDLCFGFPLPQEVTMNLSYQEAKTKFKAWLKQKDELHVGDEIVGIYSDGEKSPPLVVLKVEGNYYFGIYSKTGAFVQGGLNYEKTGRHFPEVAELLEKMRGEEE